MAEPAETPAGGPGTGEGRKGLPSGGGAQEGREPLSAEEIRGLLGEDPAEGGEESARDGTHADAEVSRVLVVSRDEDQIQTLRGVLGSLDIEVSTVKNPFSALDQLRLRRYAGVISDFELWAEKGSLLFSRLASCGIPTPVVFICGSPEADGAARTSGAVEVLRKPLQPADLARTARIFQSAAARIAPPGRPAPGSRPPDRSPAAGPRGERGGSARQILPSPLPAPMGPDVPWLRFFFECRRAMRSAPSRKARMEVILECFQQEMGPHPCGVGIALEGGWWILARPGSREVLSMIGRALAGGPPPAKEARACGAGEAGDGGAGLPENELLAWWSAGSRPSVFAAFSSDVSFGPARLLEKFLQELAHLLAEAEEAPQ